MKVEKNMLDCSMLSNCMMEKLKLLPLIFCEKLILSGKSGHKIKRKKKNEKLGHDTVAINCGRKIS